MYTTEQYKVLEAERDALAMQNHKLRNVLKDVCNRNWTYAQCEELQAITRGREALDESDLHTEVIAKHDAGVLREAAERLESYEYIRNAPPINFAESHELRRMADELEKK